MKMQLENKPVFMLNHRATDGDNLKKARKIKGFR